MKKIIKQNKLLCLLILSLLIAGLIVVIKWQFDYQNYVKQYEDAIHYMANHEDKYIEYLTNGFYNLEYVPSKPDALSLFIYLTWDSFLWTFNWIMPLTIIVISSLKLSRHLRTGYVKNILTRQSYKEYITKIIGKAWMSSLIIPLFWLYFLFLCYLVTGNFQLNPNGYCATFISNITIDVWKLVCMYFIYLVIHSAFCTNLAIIFTKKKRDFIVSSILAYIVFLIVNYYYSVIVWYAVDSYLFSNNYLPSYNIIANFSVMAQDFLMSGGGYLISLIIIITSFLLSFLGVMLMYGNKEKVMIESET